MSRHGSSLRDPAATTFVGTDRVLRAVRDPVAAQTLEGLLDAAWFRAAIEHGLVIPTQRAAPESPSEGTRCALLLEHERVSFPSYPYEWCPEMLASAGGLTLDLATSALAHGLGLKDATPYNVLFRGAAPVFVDVSSFEQRDACDPTWLPYGQFSRTFVLPLLASRRLGIDLAGSLIAHRDGLEPSALYQAAGWGTRLSPTFFRHVTLPTWLTGTAARQGRGLYGARRSSSPEQARFVVHGLLRGLRRDVDRLAAGGAASAWSGYMGSLHYSARDMATKEAFLGSALTAPGVRRLLDVGCNTGHFSLLAAGAGAGVVAIDSDPVVVDRAHRVVRERRADVLTLAVNLARPTPATGWRNAEARSFLDRAARQFDVVLMYAVVHHLMVSEGIPLAEIVDLVAQLTRDAVVAEFVPPADPMFQRILRGRDDLYRWLTPASFAAAWQRAFELVDVRALEDCGRVLYRFRKKT